MSTTENEAREKKGRNPDFPWKNRSLEGQETPAEESPMAPDDMRPWGSFRSAAQESQNPDEQSQDSSTAKSKTANRTAKETGKE